ncbi:hypothetical protein QTP88_021106 [Uroleucon formosanum]
MTNNDFVNHSLPYTNPIALMIYENKQTKHYAYVIHYTVNTDARRPTGFVDNKLFPTYSTVSPDCHTIQKVSKVINFSIRITKIVV